MTATNSTWLNFFAGQFLGPKPQGTYSTSEGTTSFSALDEEEDTYRSGLNVAASAPLRGDRRAP